MADNWKKAKANCERASRIMHRSCAKAKDLQDEEEQNDQGQRAKLLRGMKTLKPTLENELTEMKEYLRIYDNDIDDLGDHKTDDQENYSVSAWDACAEARSLMNGLQVGIEAIELEQKQAQQAHLHASQAQNTTMSRQSQMKVKLPKMELLRFRGDRYQWKPFWDLFESTVHKNEYLEPVDKLNYLVSVLDQEPQRIVSSLPLTNENYQVAIDLLLEYYGDAQAVVEDIYTKMMNLKSPTAETRRLREFHVEIEMNLLRLETLGESISGNHWVVMIKSKLPKSVVFNLENRKDNDVRWTVQTLRKALLDEIRKRESVEGLAKNEPRNDNGKSRSSQSQFWTDDMTTTMTASDKNPQRRYNCAFCDGNHYSDKCDRVKTVSDRQDKLRENRCCFRCLKPGHQSKTCRNTKPCYYCKGNHNQSLCSTTYGGSSTSAGKQHRFSNTGNKKGGNGENSYVGIDNEKDSSGQDKDQSPVKDNEHGLLAVGESGILQMARACLAGRGATTTHMSLILLDGGSSRTYLTMKKAKMLNLKLQNCPPLEVNRFFGDDHPVPVKAKQAMLDVVVSGKRRTLSVTVVDKIADPVMKVPIPTKLLVRYSGLKMADTNPERREDREIDLLIGSDYYFDFVTGEKIQIDEGLYLIGSEFGWIVSGRLKTTNLRTTQLFLQTTTNYDDDLLSFQDCDDEPLRASDLTKFWDLDVIGINDCPYVKDDDVVWNDFKNSVKFEDGRYQVKWPLKNHSSTLPTNFGLAIGRFRHLLRRLEHKPELYQKYRDIIRDQEAKTIIERVDDTTAVPKGLIHYISHHPVETPQKSTTKVRIVYDASARQGSFPSLNDVLHRGAVILEDLVGLLLRFRLRKVAVISDIEKAFLQVGLQPTDRDLARFLWLKDDTKPYSEDNLQVMRFCRVAFGMKSSPFLLGATIRHHLECQTSPVSDIIRTNCYVDNVITSIDETEDANALYMEGKAIFNSAGMNLREWLSNSNEVMKSIPDVDRSKSKTVKVLGIEWDSQSDVMRFHLDQISIPPSFTRRSMMRQVSTTFDPLGLLAPITLPLKLFMQKITTKRTRWNDVLSKDTQTTWEALVKETFDKPVIEMPRLIGATTIEPITLCCFVDASPKAYAACAYLRRRLPGGFVTGLLFAKCRLSPKDSMTIPRLELLAAVIGSRIVKFLRKELRLKEPLPAIIWSDSQCVLNWIKSKKEFSVFVQNRIDEIRQTKDVEFRYVATKDNPADLPTRGVPASVLPDTWWYGPAWLKLAESEWPKYNEEEMPDDEKHEVDKELREKKYPSLVATDATTMITGPLGIQPERFNSVTKLWRVTALALKAIRKMRKQDKEEGDTLSQANLRDAKHRWDKFVQDTHLSDIRTELSTNRMSKKAIVRQLGLSEDDDGIIRCYGRYANAQIQENAKYPVLLPKSSPYTDLVVRECHDKLLHSGPSHTLAEIRQEYWIPSGRTVVKRLISDCPGCKRFTAHSYQLPKMPHLPRSRVVPETPFKYTGLDYFGPFTMKMYDGVKEQKVWICLFTCLVVRAIHAEVVLDMTTDSFLTAIRRFKARFGKPASIICDNAPQFKLGSTVLSEALRRFAGEDGIDWKFIPEYAPWVGGVYERMVSILKKAFVRAIGRSKLSFDQLQTLLAEAISVVNKRPLTYVEDDLSTILTPGHFLGYPKDSVIGIPQPVDNDPDYQPIETNRTHLIALWKKGQRLLQEFWKVWERQYLLSLRERTEWFHKDKRCAIRRSPKIGEVILIYDPLRTRTDWALARISSLDISSDGAIRSVKCLLPNGNTTTRPVNHLYSLEVPDDEGHDQVPLGGNEDRKNSPIPFNTNRPQRKAAVVARERFQGHLDSDDE